MIPLLPPEEFCRLTEADCVAIQRELAPRVVRRWAGDAPPRTATGVDIAYWREGEREMAVCCLVVIHCETGELLEERDAAGEVSFPYLPGCFAFRELPLVLSAAKKLEIRPDIFLFDGNGILHPRRMGLASHAAFYLEAPTAGIAKRYYQVAGADPAPLGEEAGSRADILLEGELLGRAVRTHTGVRPVYLSVGSGVDLDTVTRLALRLTGPESHIPLPTRLADLATHRRREALRSRGKNGSVVDS